MSATPRLARQGLPMPIELAITVASFLPPSALKTFSLCSKQCRELSVLFLYASLRLSPASSAAFEESGTLHHIRKTVRHISLPDVVPWKRPTEARPVSFLSFLNFTENLFPDVTSLHIRFDARDLIEVFLIDAIMSRASRYPFYHSLRDLTLERISIPDPEAFAALPIGVTGQRESEHEIFDTVEVDNKNLSRVFGDREHMDLCLGLTYPQFLTDVSITTTSFGFSEPKPFQPVHHRGAFSFLSASAHTLRRLKITASTFSTPINSVLRSQYLEEPGFTVYPALKHLEIIIPDNRLYQNFVEEWVHRFPNVEVLNVHAHLGMYMWAGDAEYNIYLRLEHLRHVKLPWPGTITPLSHQMGVELVRRVVSFWMLRGMPHLEDIQFVELDSTCRERATTCTVSRKPIANSSITGGNDELGWSMEWHEDPEEAQGGNCFFSDDFYRNGYGDVDLQLGAFTDSL